MKGAVSVKTIPEQLQRMHGGGCPWQAAWRYHAMAYGFIPRGEEDCSRLSSFTFPRPVIVHHCDDSPHMKQKCSLHFMNNVQAELPSSNTMSRFL